jgi:hypothetical protein
MNKLITIAAAFMTAAVGLTMTTYADGDRQLPTSYPVDIKEDQQKRSEALTMYQQFRNIDLEGIMETAEFKTDPATLAWLKNDNKNMNEHESHVIRQNYRYTLKLRDGNGTITYYKTKDPNCTLSDPATTGVPIVRQARVYISIENWTNRFGYDTIVRLEVYNPESGETSLSVDEVLKGNFTLSTGDNERRTEVGPFK